MDGIIRFVSPAENRVAIVFDDQVTDEKRIVQALELGGVAIPGNKTPAQGSPFFYK
jgi:copper chaperone CopZ